jgi:hypothetical protein
MLADMLTKQKVRNTAINYNVYAWDDLFVFSKLRSRTPPACYVTKSIANSCRGKLRHALPGADRWLTSVVSTCVYFKTRFMMIIEQRLASRPAVMQPLPAQPGRQGTCGRLMTCNHFGSKTCSVDSR